MQAYMKSEMPYLGVTSVPLRDAGRVMVMDRCPAIEWPRLGLGR